MIAAAAVVTSARKQRLSAGVGCLLLLGLTLGALGHVAIQARHNEVAFELAREQRRNLDLLEEARKLKSEIARLRHPARIEQMARTDLNMAPVGPMDIRSLPK